MVKKILKNKLLLTALASTLLLSNVSTIVFAEPVTKTTSSSIKVGDKLSVPEKGWKRIKYNDKSIEYSDTGWYNQEDVFSYASKYKLKNQYMRFNFTGTKLRFIAPTWGSGSENIQISIDNKIIETFSIKGSADTNLRNMYEILNLESKEHFVEIKNLDKDYIFVNAIDIDENGELKPYNSEKIVLDVKPEKEIINIAEEVSADLVIDNISEIAAEDIKIKYDKDKLKYIGCDEIKGIKLVVEDNKTAGELRFIVASEGKENIVNAKEVLLKLRFKGIKRGEALIDITSGRVSDGIEMERELGDKQCDEATIIIDVLGDVNRSSEVTLLDLAIDARHFNEDPKDLAIAKYNTDIIVNDAIDEADLLEIGKLLLGNSNYTPNN